MEKHWSCRIHSGGHWLGDLRITALPWASISLCVCVCMCRGDEEASVSGRNNNDRLRRALLKACYLSPWILMVSFGNCYVRGPCVRGSVLEAGVELS